MRKTRKLSAKQIRENTRKQAINTAAQALRDQGILFDMGSILLIVPRFRKVVAFDAPEDIEGITRHADAIKYEIAHITADQFDAKRFDRLFMTTLKSKPAARTIKHKANPDRPSAVPKVRPITQRELKEIAQHHQAKKRTVKTKAKNKSKKV